MRNIWTIAKREFNNYFSSPVAYAVAFLFLSIVGIIFVLNLMALSNNPYGYTDAPDVRMITGPMAFMLMLATPALTMRLVADEVRMGTMELLLTAPLRDYELVVGKWLGAFLFVLSVAALTLVFPIIINNFVTPGIDWKVILSSYIGLILVCSALLALGTGISAIFTNQFAAFFVTLGLFFFLWFMISLPASYLQEGGDVLNYLSISTHFSQSMNNGTINLGDIVYYLSLTALGLFIGTTAVEIRRWR